MKKLLILVGVLGVIVVGLVIATFMSINPIIEKAVNTAGPKILLTNVHLDKADVSFMSGSGKLQGLVVGSPKGFSAPQTMKLGAMEVQLDTGSLTKDVIIIEKVLIANPELTYEKSGKLDNFTALLNNVKQTVGGNGGAAAPAKEEAPAESGTGPKVVIRDLLITGAKVNMALTALGGQGMTLTLPDIHLTNIGEESGGATPAEAMQKVLGTLNGEMTTAVTGALGESVKKLQESVKGATDALKEGDASGLQKLGEGLKGIMQ
ncbi:hypothetical protein N1030_10190 [Desulfovibrio mangrovi]|uniref:hypothetical protein n=1 Tax=Desulfovibrio mangrovi TaxID=2976983 RepID=UPI00224708BB|nr:hypothetical protein [Desulfovibrio mangrovi]UZP65993.1 hypothetical protein N1030_10190 [Desulfovibrio mangrovi]